MARPQNQWMNEQQVLVDQAAGDQRANQLAAPENPEVLPRLLLELGHGVDGVALEQLRVLPWERLLQGRRGDVLLRSVEHLGVRIVLLLGPKAGEVLIGTTTEHEWAPFGHPLSHRPAHYLVAIWNRPSAVFEPAARVLIGAAGRLHHAVEGEALDHGDLSHLGSFQVLGLTRRFSGSLRVAQRAGCRQELARLEQGLED